MRPTRASAHAATRGDRAGDDPAPGRALPARWLWLAAAPLAWALHELLAYAGSSIACHAGDGAGAPRVLGLPLPNLVVGVVSLAALAVGLVATVRLWRWWRAHPCPPAGDGATRVERLRFLTVVAGSLGVLCVYGVLLAAGATFLRGCG
ncbi:MAG TPA: hypothetical protein VFS08_17340 [Gemmatimonadaceae bacterium]|nr:hypothetical protein [Gemmatimonadaceae bacterium]